MEREAFGLSLKVSTCRIPFHPFLTELFSDSQLSVESSRDHRVAQEASRCISTRTASRPVRPSGRGPDDRHGERGLRVLTTRRRIDPARDFLHP